MDEGRNERGALLVRAALVALPPVALRTGFHALQEGVLHSGVPRLIARHAARHLLEGFALAAVPALVLAWAVAAASRRRAGTAALGALLLAGAGLAFAFVTFRLPPSADHAIRAETGRGIAALAVAAAVALVAPALALPGLRVPLRRTGAALVPLGCAAAALVLLAWPPRAREGRPNLILISLDTLRRDRLGCYGNDRGLTPALDAFAARSLRFDNAFSVMPWTLTAHMSMLTGLYPTVHGVDEESALPRGIPTLADQLGAAGYVTLGVADEVAWVSPRFGYARGFDVYEQVKDDAALKVDRVLGLLDDVGDDPFFLFAHFFDAHSDWRDLPYEAHPADLEELAAWYDGDGSDWCTPEGLCASKLLLKMAEDDERMEGERLERLKDLYDAGVRSLDRQLGRLFDELERRGLFESTAIVVTADHGEELFDHGKPLHGRCYDVILGVPFLLHVPPASAGDADAVGRSTDAVVSLVDVLPTFLDLAGVEPAAPHQGLSLAPLARGEPLARDRDGVVIHQVGGFSGLRGERYSLVPLGNRRILFDVQADPGQREELPPDERPKVRRLMEARLAEEEAAAETLRALLGGEGVDAEIGAEDRARLEDLGYAGD